MIDLGQSDCNCGHESALHDTHGCAAFLGAFPNTAHVKRYCACRRAADAVLTATKTRPLDVIPPHDGVKQALRVQYDGNRGWHIRVEQLR